MAPISTRERRSVNAVSFLPLSTFLKERSDLHRLSETYTPPIIPTSYSDTDNGLGPGATAVIVLGSVCGVLCISWLLYICFIKYGRGHSPPSKPSKTAQRGQRKRGTSKYTRPRTKNARSRYQPKPKPKPKPNVTRPVSRAPPVPVPQHVAESRKSQSEIGTLEQSSHSPYPEKNSDHESYLPSGSHEIVVIEEICSHELSKSGEKSRRRSRESRRTHNTTEPFMSQTHSSHIRS
ncbi:hypothetical protein GcM1_242078 [Golovinomyces cichoracearum]|uniref:Uncharacterized protein n=1 Tax=Golovinomyces cichoracearum TaxID=62708 RepID=A0A420IH56_9PEZI|nr:hypothetical protein GcM1_242078 [Golovinomyces cichoracearum]